MRAAIYLRLSKEDKQESIENQRALLRKYANDHGFSVVKEYTDEAISGLTDTEQWKWLIFIFFGTAKRILTNKSAGRVPEQMWI